MKKCIIKTVAVILTLLLTLSSGAVVNGTGPETQEPSEIYSESEGTSKTLFLKVPHYSDGQSLSTKSTTYETFSAEVGDVFDIWLNVVDGSGNPIPDFSGSIIWTTDNVAGLSYVVDQNDSTHCTVTILSFNNGEVYITAKSNGNTAKYIFEGESYTPASDFIYSVESENVSIDYYIGNDKKVNIPPSIEGKPVTKLNGVFKSYSPEGIDINENIKNIETIIIPRTIDTIGQNCFLGCKGLKQVNYRGCTDEWNLICHQKQLKATTGDDSRYLSKAKIICSGSDVSWVSFINKSNYIYVQDSYNFYNQTTEISYDIYKTLYGFAAAQYLRAKDDGKGGQCFGMANTTSLLLNGYLSKVRDLNNNPVSCIDLVDTTYKIESPVLTDFSVEDFIKVGYVLQNYSKVQKQIAITENNPNSLYLALKNDKQICINIKKNVPFIGWGHTVLPVGIAKTDDGYDIYINNSIYPRELFDSKIHLTGSVNNFTGWSYIEDGETKLSSTDFGASISYTETNDLLKYFVENGKLDGNEVAEDILVYLKGSSSVSVDDNNIDFNYKNGFVDGTCIPISTCSGNEYTDGNFYWINSKSGKIQFENVIDDSLITLASGNYAIDFSIDNNNSATVSINDYDLKDLIINTQLGDTFKYKATNYNMDGKSTEILITGVAEKDNVKIIQKEDCVLINGVSKCEIIKNIDGEIQYSKEYTNAPELQININDNSIENSNNASATANAVINVAGEKTIKYRTKVTIKATAANLDSGYHLVLCIDGKEIKGNSKEVSYEYGELKSDVNYSVKIVNESNITQKDKDGKALEKSGGKITCNAGFFVKIIAFFQGLFNALPSETVEPKH